MARKTKNQKAEAPVNTVDRIASNTTNEKELAELARVRDERTANRNKNLHPTLQAIRNQNPTVRSTKENGEPAEPTADVSISTDPQGDKALNHEEVIPDEAKTKNEVIDISDTNIRKSSPKDMGKGDDAEEPESETEKSDPFTDEESGEEISDEKEAEPKSLGEIIDETSEDPFVKKTDSKKSKKSK